MTLVKKLGAIALGSILLASTLVPLAAAQLDVKTAVERLGAPGDYWIVVGRDALVDDIISAIDLATRFAGFATTEKQLTGTKEYEIKGWDARLNLDSQNLTTGLPGFISIYDKNVLPQLKDNLIVRNGTRTISGVAEYVKLATDTSFDKNTTIYANSTLAIALGNKEYLTYYVALDDNTCKNRIYADATQGLLVRFKLAGKDVVVSEVGNNKVKLLSGFGPEWINAGDVRDITGTSYKLRLDNVIGFGSDAIVQLSVIDERGVAYPLALYPGQYDVEPTTGVKVVVLRAFGYGDTKMAYLVAGVESEVGDGERLDNLFQWYVATCSGTTYLKEIGYKLAPNETVYLEPGQSIAFPNNYLKLQYLGLTLTEKDYLATVNFRVVDIDTTKVVGLQNANSTAVEISGVPLYTGTKVYNKLYVVFNNSHTLLAELNSTGYYVPVSGNVIVGPTGLSLGLSFGGTQSETTEETKNGSNEGSKNGSTGGTQNGSTVSVMLNKDGSNQLTLVVNVNDKVITDVNGISDFRIGVNNLISNFNNTWVYTAFGHKIFVSSDAKSLTLKWTPVQGFARVVLGEATEKVAGGDVVRVLDVNRLQVPVAKLDTEVNLATVDKNLVVVGGPYVNRVAAALLNVPYRDDSAIRALYEDLGAIERGLIKAFDLGGGKVALLVAGWRAEDTRLAASVLQQYERFADRLAAGDTLIIGGTREAPTIEAKTSK